MGAAGAGGGGGASTATTSSSSSGFITLVQISRFSLELSLSESDIGKVKVGQPATVTVNAADGEQFAAHVTEIGVLASSSSSSTASSSAVSYPVTLTLDQHGSKIKAGMSATADIVTSQASGIAVPTQALTGSSVTVVRNGKRSTQAVTTGVAGDSTTQVLSGLSDGDSVIVRSASATAGAASSSAQPGLANGQRQGPGGGRFGGPGGGFPGGGGGGFPGGGRPPGGG
jgi:hypothetical protein